MGLWQFTLGITYSPFAIGPGGVLTFGYNHGQFNLGGWLGASAGDAFSFNPADAPCHKPGTFGSTRAEGKLGAGVLGVDFTAQSGPHVNSTDFNAGVPGVKSLEIGVGTDDGEISTTPQTNIVGGAQAFLGAGAQWYSSGGTADEEDER